MIKELFGSPLGDPFYIGVYLEWTVNVLGLIVCVWGYQKTKAKSLLIIAIFFTQPLWGIAFREVQYRLNKETIDQFIEMKNQEIQRKMERGEIIEIDSSINLPAFEFLLVLGLFTLVRNGNLVEPVAGGEAAR